MPESIYLQRYAPGNQGAGVGIRAILVHAKDDAAKRFYQHFDFDPSPVDPLHLYLIVKDIARLAKTP